MVDIPESLLRRSAEAKAKALGVPVEEVLAEMKGEGPAVEVPAPPSDEVVTPPSDEDTSDATGEAIAALPPDEQSSSGPSAEHEESTPEAGPEEEETPVEEPLLEEVSEEEKVPAAVATAVEEIPPEAGEAEGTGSGNGKVAGLVSPRPTVPPTGLPEGVRTQRLLTVVKARAIQNVKAEPQDRVNTWPHLLLIEFGALLAITGLLVIMAVVIHSPLLDPANLNATPNPSKAPWYFL